MIRCLLFGHAWEEITDGVFRCFRCGKTKVTNKYRPVSTLDQIVHDKDWYTPKKKR